MAAKKAASKKAAPAKKAAPKKSAPKNSTGGDQQFVLVLVKKKTNTGRIMKKRIQKMLLTTNVVMVKH